MDQSINVKDNINCHEGLSTSQANELVKSYGYNELKEEKESKFKKLIKPFWGPIPWLIEIAAILSACIQHWEDFIIILFMLLLNAFIEFTQESKAESALDALKKSMALKARVKRDGKWQDIAANQLVPGDVINLSNGDIVPADCQLLKGAYLSIDQSALTGESLPVDMIPGDTAYSSSIIKQGDMECLVTGTGKKTFFGKTAQLVQSANNTSHFQESILNIGKFLIYGALGLAVLIIAKELYMSDDPFDTLQLVLVLVIASIPVAMPAVLSVTMTLGALVLSKKKAIVSRLQSIEEMAGVEILCSDKTGTLTQNKLTLNTPALYQADSDEILFLMALLASNVEGKDAIDSAISAKVDVESLKKYRQLSFIPFDPVSKKTEAVIKFNEQEFKVIKGAPQVIIDLCQDDEEVKENALKDVNDFAVRGLRSLAVAKTDVYGEYHLLGILSLYDPPREDSKLVIAQANTYGIDVKMVTGDDLAIGKEISRELNLGSNLKAASEIFKDSDDMDAISDKIRNNIVHSDGFARVFPEHKYGIVKAFQTSGKIVAMTGDGVNDAPALKQADIGIAVSGATDAARSAADLILTAPGLSVITDAVEESRKIFRRMINYVNYRVAMTINIMLFVTLSILFSDTVPLTAIMIVMLALLDDIPIMAIAYDNADISNKPIKWDLKKVLSLATVVGLFSVIESFMLMAGVHYYLPSQSFEQMQTIIFLQLVVAGHLLLFVSRHQTWFWLKPWPSLKLTAAVVSTQIIAIFICKFGWFVTAISWDLIFYVWVYAIIWMFVLNIVSHTYQKYGHKKKY